MSLYSDGSPQTVEITGSEYQAVGAALTKGPLRILVRDNMAVTKYANKQPTRECSYCDVCHKVCDHTQHKRVIME